MRAGARLSGEVVAAAESGSEWSEEEEEEATVGAVSAE